MLPVEFKQFLIEKSLYLLKKQWGQLGVWCFNFGESGFHSDPETAIAYSEYFEKYAPEVGAIANDWLRANSKFANRSRLSQIRRFINKEVGASIGKNPNFGYQTNSFMSTLDIENHFSRLLRLRLIFGCTTKAEALFFLLNNKEGNSNRIALDRFQNQKAVYNSLQDLSSAGVLLERRSRNMKMYKIDEKMRSFIINERIQKTNLAFLLNSVVIILEKILTEDNIDNVERIFSAIVRNRKGISGSVYSASGIILPATDNGSQLYMNLISIMRQLFDIEYNTTDPGKAQLSQQLSIN